MSWLIDTYGKIITATQRGQTICACVCVCGSTLQGQCPRQRFSNDKGIILSQRHTHTPNKSALKKARDTHVTVTGFNVPTPPPQALLVTIWKQESFNSMLCPPSLPPIKCQLQTCTRIEALCMLVCKLYTNVHKASILVHICTFPSLCTP